MPYKLGRLPKTGVDPACYELAQHFLADKEVTEPPTEGAVTSLSETIQRAVEQWFHEHEQP
jgi:hypothetical protein